jgi:hypothetical protein
MTLQNKKFGNYEVCDGLYNSFLCIIKNFKFQSPSHIEIYILMTNTK